MRQKYLIANILRGFLLLLLLIFRASFPEPRLRNKDISAGSVGSAGSAGSVRSPRRRRFRTLGGSSTQARPALPVASLRISIRRVGPP